MSDLEYYTFLAGGWLDDNVRLLIIGGAFLAAAVSWALLSRFDRRQRAEQHASQPRDDAEGGAA